MGPGCVLCAGDTNSVFHHNILMKKATPKYCELWFFWHFPCICIKQLLLKEMVHITIFLDLTFSLPHHGHPHCHHHHHHIPPHHNQLQHHWPVVIFCPKKTTLCKFRRSNLIGIKDSCCTADIFWSPSHLFKKLEIVNLRTPTTKKLFSCDQRNFATSKKLEDMCKKVTEEWNKCN